MHRRRISSNIIRRRWILVGLLPYLLLMLTDGGFHHHPGIAAPGETQSLPGLSTHQMLAPAQLQADSDCPACQWLVAASACVLVSLLPLAMALTLRLALSPVLRPVAFSPLFLNIRAPPSA
jgi:hypothetical protein